MVKIMMSTMTMATVAADDLASLLQMSKQGEDAICVQAAAGDVAPVTGSFTAIGQAAAVVVAAGSVAGETGTFCYAKQDVLLMQRTFVSNTAHDLENTVALKGPDKWDAQASDDYVKHEGKICYSTGTDPANLNIEKGINQYYIKTASSCRSKCDMYPNCVAFGYGGDSKSARCLLSSAQTCLTILSSWEHQGHVEGHWYMKKDAVDMKMLRGKDVEMKDAVDFLHRSGWTDQQKNARCRKDCARIYHESSCLDPARCKNAAAQCIADYQC